MEKRNGWCWRDNWVWGVYVVEGRLKDWIVEFGRNRIIDGGIVVNEWFGKVLDFVIRRWYEDVNGFVEVDFEVWGENGLKCCYIIG